ncbi:branched-chain amino acid ABC transporter permease [Pseudotabrizicola sediminis]|uniref:Branched-chain amino acid ABC transporter permease n=1 Tax=Pseudotabrizicola sediminis TaxID=2486418 RepID=A0ABY2KP34_9RHOB|nr:branched-chain amino acid ABC transporter permease [Pseudotabrizicola sediminis]TGD42608.1 branched-chain amino acid ABC transporter permease [Pseudotabrizicola sediminis]TGD62322.1 branched-chain amino acid ABC transporter permease [Tabrizicola sp. WMC-M-20]
MQWFDALIQGILLGGMYAQYALGMALMFGVMRIVNVSHGDLVILLSLIGISLASNFGWGPFTVMVALVPLAIALGWLLQKVVLNKVVGDDPLPSLIATFGLSIALQNMMLQIWSANSRSLPGGGIESQSIQIGGIYVGLLPVLVLTFATALTWGLDLVLKRTRFGRSLRAASADVEAASMSGINARAVYASATAIAVGILGFAAVFQSLRSTVAPADGGAQLIYAFEAVIIGGMGSVWGAFIGSMVLGVSQAIGFRIDPGFGVLAGHLVFLLVLAIRPQGLFGKV